MNTKEKAKSKTENKTKSKSTTQNRAGTRVLTVAGLAGLFFTLALFATAGVASALPCTCGDICVNETGWWRDGGVFNGSGTPIQAAEDNAAEGETVCVKDGSYNENVVVNKQRLTIRSENGTANCIVNAAVETSHVFNVTANFVNLTGLSITGATGDAAGISHEGAGSHCNFSYNNITANFNGIFLANTNNNTILGNTLTGNNCGICLESSNNNTITGNTANSNGESGIHLQNSNDNEISGNDAIENRGWDSGGIFLEDSHNNRITGNNASSNGPGIHLDPSTYNKIADNIVTGNYYHGIWLQDSSDYNQVTGNTVLRNAIECGYGIYVQSSSHNEIVENTASETGMYPGSGGSGICVEAELPSSHNNISNNNATDNFGDGITLINEDNCTVANNNASSNWGSGISLFGSFENSVTDNICNDNGDVVVRVGGLWAGSWAGSWAGVTPAMMPIASGVNLLGSDNNEISGNEANGNLGPGVQVSDSSNNKITENTATENWDGGIQVMGCGESFNTISDNTATDNFGDGIALIFEDNCTVANNNASNNTNCGIYLESSVDNNLTNNTAEANKVGILLNDACDYNTLSENRACNNTDKGFALICMFPDREEVGNSNNTLTDNTAANNTNYSFYSGNRSQNNTVKNLALRSYSTTVSFNYENGVGVKGVETGTAPPDPAGKANISKFVNATNVTGDSWIFLNVSYEEGDLGGVDEATLRIYKYNETTADWELADGSGVNGVNTAENYVYANITEFCVFAPLGTVPEVPPAPTVTQPDGGEEIPGDSVYDIKWSVAKGTYNLAANPINISYSTNNGNPGTWTEIATNEPNDGKYSWTVPNPAATSNKSLVKVEARDVEGNTGEDTSDAVFTITKTTSTENETIPAGETETVEGPPESGTTVEITTTGEVTATVAYYEENPHPEAEKPAEMLEKFVDVAVSDKENVSWPIYVEMHYTDAEVAGKDESTLGFYYYNNTDGAWHRCSNTGVNTAENYVWANLQESEYTGTLLGFGETTKPPPTETSVDTNTGTGTAKFKTSAGGFEDLVAVAEPTEKAGKPNLVFKHGFFKFNITGLAVGETVKVTIELPGDLPAGSEYWKYGPTLSNPTDHWYKFMYDGTTGAEINGNLVTLHFVEGERGDKTVGDGKIVDPGGPGSPPPTPTPTPPPVPVPEFSAVGLLSLVGVLSAVLAVARIRKRE